MDTFALTSVLSTSRFLPRWGPTARAWVALGLGCALAVSVGVVRDASYSGSAIALASAAAFAAIIVGIRKHCPANARFWRLCAGALATGVLAGALTVALPVTALSAGAIDAVYLIGYFVFVLAAVSALPKRRGAHDWASLLDALTLAIVGAIIFWYFAVSPLLAQRLNFHTILTGLVWPVFDLLLIVLVTRLATSSATRDFPFVMVVTTLAFSIVSDLWYAATTSPEGHAWGSPADALWLVPMAALGAAALHPSMSTVGSLPEREFQRSTWLRVFSVSLGAFFVPIVITAHAFSAGRLMDELAALLVVFGLLALAGVARNVEIVRQTRNHVEESHAQSRQLRSALDEQERLHDALTRSALYDHLTGLANRRLFQERLEQSLSRAGRDSAVMFIDLDDFKNINDSLGHAVGDLALVELGKRIEGCLRPTDTVARFGGDEFAVLMPGATLHGVERVGYRLLKAVQDPIHVMGVQFELHVSIGVAWSQRGCTSEDLLRDADVAMYHAKAEGKNRLATFQDAMLTARLDRIALHAELKAAIEGEELSVVYQPIVRLADERVDGVETLVRWRRADGCVLPTPELISLAEETGLILPLGRYVLKQAATQGRLWLERGLCFNIAVNVSAAQLYDGGFVDAVRSALVGQSEDHVLVLELTESTLVGESPAHLEVLHELRALGCRIAIDDFGTGFSSLAYLKRLPVDVLKIPGVFTEGVDRGREEASVATAILGLGSTLGYQVVAEGIEDPAEADELRRLGCTLGQGYLFSPPGTPEELDVFLEKWCEPPTPRLGSAPTPSTPSTVAAAK